MQYWLFKSEPNTWSWQDQLNKGDKAGTLGWGKKFSSCKKYEVYEDWRFRFFFTILLMKKEL